MKIQTFTGRLVATGTALDDYARSIYSYAIFETTDGQKIKAQDLVVTGEMKHHMEPGTTGKFVLVKKSRPNLAAAETDKGTAISPDYSKFSGPWRISIMIIVGLLTMPIIVGSPILLLGLVALYLDKRNKRVMAEVTSSSGIKPQAIQQF